MFSDRFQGKLMTVFYSVGSKPLAIWKIESKEGDIRTVQDEHLKSNVLQILSNNVTTCSISTPPDSAASLGIRLPFIVLLMKNLNRYFTFEITVLDNVNVRRRFRVSNYQSATRVSMYMCTMPLCLNNDWNQIQFNLANFTERTFNTTYVETVRIQVHANCRVRRIYFCNQLYPDEQLPFDYRMFSTKPLREKPKSMLVKKVKKVKA
ncbi:uncharacterized protein LOC126837535 [Adelges cooleyi]|uniref:uncharacterized protein LOC126837535 n=1 Tax=Adelges cooleyi TaxID=133065 RepID=UPI00217F9315|nr:uncharacterized protein LOC126837535 [Adelges cooleyi]